MLVLIKEIYQEIWSFFDFIFEGNLGWKVDIEFESNSVVFYVIAKLTNFYVTYQDNTCSLFHQLVVIT